MENQRENERLKRKLNSQKKTKEEQVKKIVTERKTEKDREN